MTSLLELYQSAFPILLHGAWLTTQVSLISIVIGLFFGFLLGIWNCDELRRFPISTCIDAYVHVIRGTPLFVQLLIAYFALPQVLGLNLSAMGAGILTLGLNSSAYLSETIRGGINGVSKGQWEAAWVLGYTPLHTLRYIILPQATRNVLPAITNELAVLIKESSILMVIGVSELVKVSKDMVARELRPMEIYLLTALLYLVMTSIITLLSRMLEAKIK